jgi:hypothetical protein
MNLLTVALFLLPISTSQAAEGCKAQLDAIRSSYDQKVANCPKAAGETGYLAGALEWKEKCESQMQNYRQKCGSSG